MTLGLGLGLDAAPVQVTPQRALVKKTSQSVFHILRCCRNAGQTPDVSLISQGTVALANMRDASDHGLDHMPNKELAVAVLVLSPDAALRPDARSPLDWHREANPNPNPRIRRSEVAVLTMIGPHLRSGTSPTSRTGAGKAYVRPLGYVNPATGFKHSIQTLNPEVPWGEDDQFSML